MSKAVVFMADGMEMCECLLTVDILRRAGVEVVTASVMGRKKITSSHKVKMYADEVAEDVDIDSADLIVLPGGRVGTENLAASGIVKSACVKFAADDTKHIAAVCAAPSVLAGLGLLEGKHATVHPDFEGKMDGAVLTYDGVTVDGNIVTGQGLGATYDFALTLAEMLAGKEAADTVRTKTCYRG